jgi:hypothetical protein
VLVAPLLDGALAGGEHILTWSGRDDGGRALSSGGYLLRLEATGQASTSGIVLLE